MTRGSLYFVVGILVIFCVYYAGFAASKVLRHRRTKSHKKIGSESCETSAVRQNVTLRGGIKAGYFHKLAQYVAMELCVQLCCEEKGCDVAFMIGKNCYGVKCFSEKLCHVVPAKNAPRALMISKVDFRGEVYLQKFMPEKLKCFQTLVERNVTLNGGLTAGNFTAVGHTETIDACARLCCVRDNCDLAFLVNDHCFLVRCQNAEQCRSTPVRNVTFRTCIARVNRTKETAEDQQTVHALSSIPGKTSTLMCKNGVIQYNQTLLGGYGAGKFKVLAHSTNMSACIRLCCGEKTCDVALMIENKCYGVVCETLQLCRTIPAKNSAMLSHLNPRISYITSRNEEVNSITLRRHSEICKSNVISYDVTLRGGRHAGKYKTYGEVEDMGECIRICCMQNHCDVAFMISGVCFTVRCYSDEACEEVYASGSGFKPMLSYVVREKPSKHHGWHHDRTHVNGHASKHKKVKGVHKLSKNNETSPDVPHIPSPNLPSLDNDHYCTNSEIMYNVTLRGGITAGKFRDRGVLPNMQECLRICCIAKSCDLAFMLGNHCFSVTCKNQTLCEVVTARSTTYNPRVAYIYARSKTADRKVVPKKPSTTRRGHSRTKSRKKGHSSSSKHVKDSSVSKVSKKHRKQKKIIKTATKSQRNNSRSSYTKDMLLLKKLSLKKLKLESKKTKKNPQTSKYLTNAILLQESDRVNVHRNSIFKNMTPLVEFYKNNTDIPERIISPGISKGILNQAISPKANATDKTLFSTEKEGPLSAIEEDVSTKEKVIFSTKKEKFSKKEKIPKKEKFSKKGEEIANVSLQRSDNTTSKKMVQNLSISQNKGFQIRPIATRLLSYGRGTNFKDFTRNMTVVNTPGYQNFSFWDSFSRHGSIERNSSRNSELDGVNQTSVNHVLLKVGTPILGSNTKNETPRVTLPEMVSKTTDSSLKKDSDIKTLFSSKYKSGESQIMALQYLNNNTNRNPATPEYQFAQRLSKEIDGLSSSKYNSKGKYISKYNAPLTSPPAEQVKTTDLTLLEAFSPEQDVKSINTSEVDFQLKDPPLIAVSPQSFGTQETDKKDLLLDIENNKTNSIAPEMSVYKTGVKVSKVEKDTKNSHGDGSNFPNVAQPLNITKNTILPNNSSSRVETGKG